MALNVTDNWVTVACNRISADDLDNVFRFIRESVQWGRETKKSFLVGLTNRLEGGLFVDLARGGM